MYMFIKRIQPLLIFLTCLLSFPYLSFAQVNEEISIIVEVEDNPYKWKKFIEDYHPFVEVVQVYDTLLNALALKGDPKDLNKIEKADIGIRYYNINGSESFLLNPHKNVKGWITDYPDKIKQIQKKTFKQME